MRKYVHKLFAAFLSVCLLMSYNPGLGMAAERDVNAQVTDPSYVAPEDLTFNPDRTGQQDAVDQGLAGGGAGNLDGSGTASASSTISIGTFTDDIETASSQFICATVQQLIDSASTPNPLYAGVAATGGKPSSYTFTWNVYKDGTNELLGTYENHRNAVHTDVSPNDDRVMISKLDLTYLADIGKFVDGEYYRFECTVTDGVRTAVANPIYLLTVKDDPAYDGYFIDRTVHGNTNGFVADPGNDVNTADDADWALNYNDVAVHSDLMYKETAIQVNQAKVDNGNSFLPNIYTLMQVEAGKTSGADLSPVWNVELSIPDGKPSTFPDGTAIAKHLGNKLTVYLPLVKASSNYGSTPANLEAGSSVEVLWTETLGSAPAGSHENQEVKHLPATVVEHNGVKYVALDFPQSGIEAALTGCFAILYDNKYDPDHPTNPVNPADHFTVTVNSTTKHLDGTSSTNDPSKPVGGWFEPFSADLSANPFPQSVIDYPVDAGASYAIKYGTPADPSHEYKLEKLVLKEAGQPDWTLYDSAATPPITNQGRFYVLNPNLDTLAIRSIGTDVVLDATFVESDGNQYEAENIAFDAKVLSESEFLADDPTLPANPDTSKHGTLQLVWTDEDGATKSEPSPVGTFAEELNVADMPNNGSGFMILKPNDASNGTNYALKGMRMAVTAANATPMADDWTVVDVTDARFIHKLNTIANGEKVWFEVYFGAVTGKPPVEFDFEATINSSNTAHGGVYLANAPAGGSAGIQPNGFKVPFNTVDGNPHNITVKANPGYKLKEVEVSFEVDGKTHSWVTPNTLTADADGKLVYALPKLPNSYTVLLKFEPVGASANLSVTTRNTDGTTPVHGTVSPAHDQTVYGGGTYNFQIVPERGYKIASAQLTGTGTTPLSTIDLTKLANNGYVWTFTPQDAMVQANPNMELVVEFARNNDAGAPTDPELDDKKTMVTVTPMVGNSRDDGQPHGRLIPSDATDVQKFGNFSLVFDPDAGYEAKWVIVNGVLKATNPTSRTFVLTNVHEDTTVLVIFEKDTNNGGTSGGITDPQPGPVPNPKPDPAPDPTPLPDPTMTNNPVTINPSAGDGIGGVKPFIGGANNPLKVPVGSSLPVSFVPDNGSEFGGATITYTKSDGTQVTITLGPDDAPYVVLTDIGQGPITITPTFNKQSTTPPGPTDPDEPIIPSSKFSLTTKVSSGNGTLSPDSAIMLQGEKQTVTFFPGTTSDGKPETLGGAKVTFSANVKAYYNASTATIRFAVPNSAADKPADGFEKLLASGTLPSDLIDGIKDKIAAGGTATHNNLGLTFKNVLSDIEVDATFRAANTDPTDPSKPTEPTNPDPTDPNDPNYGRMATIDASVLGGIGDISPRGTIKVQKGADQTFVFTPIKGYKIKSVRIDGGDILGNIISGITGNPTDEQKAALQGYYTFKNVQGNHTIQVEFTVEDGYNPTDPEPGFDMRPVTVLTDGGGVVSPTGAMVKKDGSGTPVTFMVTPNSGKKIKDVVVESGADSVTVDKTKLLTNGTFTVIGKAGGTSTAAVLRVTFDDGNSTITPPPSHTVTIKPSPGGVTVPSGTVEVSDGEKLPIVIIPDPGHEVDKVWGTDENGNRVEIPTHKDENGDIIVEVGPYPDNWYTDIEVDFKESTEYYKVFARSNNEAWGTVSPWYTQAPTDKTVTLSIIPKPGYMVDSIVDSGGNNLGWVNTNSEKKTTWVVSPRLNGVTGELIAAERTIIVNFKVTDKPDDPNYYVPTTIKVHPVKAGKQAGQGVLSPDDGTVEITQGANLLMTFFVKDPKVANIYKVAVGSTESEKKDTNTVTEANPVTQGTYTLKAPDTDKDVWVTVYYGPETDKPNPPDKPGGNLDVEVGGSGSGGIQIGGTKRTTGNVRATADLDRDMANGFYTNDSMRFPIDEPEEPFDLTLTPSEGSQLGKLLLGSNVSKVSVTKDGTAYIYTLKLKDPSNPTGSLYVEYIPNDKPSYFDPENPGQLVEDDDSFTTDVELGLQTSSGGALTELASRPSDLVELRDPTNARIASSTDTRISYKIPSSAKATTFEVGPVVNLDKKLYYTVDEILVDGQPVEDWGGMVSRDPSKSRVTDPQAWAAGNGKLLRPNGDGTMTEVKATPDQLAREAEAAETPTYYEFYKFAPKGLNDGDAHEVTVKLRKLTEDEFNNGNYVQRDATSLNVEVTCSEGGTVDWRPGVNPVSFGTDVTVTWKPNNGYVLKRVVVDGTQIPLNVGDSGYTFTVKQGMNNPYRVHVEFMPKSQQTTHTLKVTVRGNGTVTNKTGEFSVTSKDGTVSIPVADGFNEVLTLTPDKGEKLKTIKVDDTAAQEWPAATYPLVMNNADHKFVAEFTNNGISGTDDPNNDDDPSGTNKPGTNNPNGSTGYNPNGTSSNGGNGTNLSQTGDNAWLMAIIVLIVVAAVCGLVAMRMRRAGAAAAAQAAQARAYREYMDYQRRR